MATKSPKSVSYKFKWIIKNVTRENFEEYDFGNGLRSEDIQTEVNDCLIEWCLEMYYNEEYEALSLGFNLLNGDESDVSMSFRVKMLNYEKTLETNLSEILERFSGWEDFMPLDKLFDPVNKLVDLNKRFTLDVEVKFTEIMMIMGDASIPTDLYSQFFNDKTFSDFTFKCSDGVEIPVHRFCLAAHSKVFMRMFTTEMEEKNSNAVIFKDISSVTMKTALKFIYTRKCTFSDVESTIKVLDVAEKYEFLKLKQHCIDQLMTHVDAENVLEIFEAADLYNAHLLEVKCLSIIAWNSEVIKRTEKYDMLEKPLIKKIANELSRLLNSVKNISIESSL